MNLKAMRLSFPPHVTHGKDINALIDYAEALEVILEEVQEALYYGRSVETLGEAVRYGRQRLEGC